MIIKISLSDWRALSKEGVLLLGQDFENYDVICAVETQPSCSFEELTTEYMDFRQSCVNPGLVSKKPTVGEVMNMLERLLPLGERGKLVDDLLSVEILEELKEKEVELDALALTILELLEV